MTNTPVSAEPSPHDDPPGSNGEPRDDVMDILRGDPSGLNPAPQDKGDVTPAPTGPLTPAPEPPKPGAAAPAAPPNPATPQPGPAAADPLQDLGPTLSKLNDTLSRTQQPQQQQQPPQEPEYDKVPDYGYDIPDSIMAGLSSENPGDAKKALQMVVTGVSQHVHKTMMGTVKTMIRQSLIPYLRNEMQQQMTIAEVFRDFYGSYGDLNNDTIRPMVVTMAQQMAQQTPNFSYNAEFKKKLAEAIYKQLNRPMPGAEPPAAPTPTPMNGTPQPPPFAGGGTRAMGGQVRRSEFDDIADTILN